MKLPELTRQRSICRKTIREFFDELSFVEAETPILVPMPGTEVHLDYFASEWVDHQEERHPLFLRSSPELHLKQLVASGLNKVFSLAPCFRNHGENSTWHHPEFVMLEWYSKGGDSETLMATTEDLVRKVYEAFANESLPQEFARLSVYDAFEEFTGIALVDGDEELATKARAKGHPSVVADDDFETAFFKLQLDVVEPRLAQLGAVFLFDYPPSMAALAQIKNDRAQRVELYLQGIELSNGFVELLDFHAHLDRFRQMTARRQDLGKQAVPWDASFLEAVRNGLPPCCGNALGFDRLFTLAAGQKDFAQTIPFRRQFALRQS